MSFEPHGIATQTGHRPRPKNEGRYGLAMVTSFNWDMGLGRPVVTVTAGCGSILDRNWRTKNSHLIGRKLVFRLEGSLEGRACRPTLFPCRSTVNGRRRRSWIWRGRVDFRWMMTVTCTNKSCTSKPALRTSPTL